MGGTNYPKLDVKLYYADEFRPFIGSGYSNSLNYLQNSPERVSKIGLANEASRVLKYGTEQLMAPIKKSKTPKESEVSLEIEERITLGKLRIEAELTYRDVANLFGREGIAISHSAIHDWEHGDRRITTNNLGVLLGFYSVHLQVEVNELYKKIGRTPPRVKEVIKNNPETMDAILKLDELPALFRKEVYRQIDQEYDQHKKGNRKR